MFTASDAALVRQFIYDRTHGLDLEEVRDLALEIYKDWDVDTVDESERCYRDFLWVCWNHDKRARSLAAISLLADKLWHCHMLLPAKYLEDCERIFGMGYVLDHTPVLPGGRAVSELDEALAAAEYAKLGVPLPADIQTRCIWAAVEPRPRAQERA